MVPSPNLDLAALPASLRETEFIAFIATVLSPGSKFYPAVRPFNGRAVSSAVKKHRLVLGCHWIPGHRVLSARNDEVRLTQVQVLPSGAAFQWPRCVLCGKKHRLHNRGAFPQFRFTL